MKNDIILIIFVIVLIIIICLSCKKNKKITTKKQNMNNINKKQTIEPNKLIYEEIISGGVTNINYHCKITLNNIYIYNSHSPLVNKSINDEYYREILLFIASINNNDLYEIFSKQDHIGDYEILNNIIRINGIDIDYKKLSFLANCDEKYNKYKMAIDKIREYKTMKQKF